MKALIERPIEQKGAMAEWHRARADVAGGRDVSVFSVRPVRQRGGCESGVEANAGALRTHTLTVTGCQEPQGMWKGCIFHTWSYSMCFCGHGSQDVMHTI